MVKLKQLNVISLTPWKYKSDKIHVFFLKGLFGE